jgi:hypothetical protein
MNSLEHHLGRLRVMNTMAEVAKKAEMRGQIYE